MRSDIIQVNNCGQGFEAATEQTKKVAAFKGLSEMETIQLQVLTEEMMSLILSVTGQIDAGFWIELEDGLAVLHLKTKTVLDKEKRAELIESASSRKNETTKTFLGRVRDWLEEALAAEPDHESAPTNILDDLPQGVYGEREWDEYERSILREMADEVKVGVQGGIAEITVSKRFGAAE